MKILFNLDCINEIVTIVFQMHFLKNPLDNNSHILSTKQQKCISKDESSLCQLRPPLSNYSTVYFTLYTVYFILYKRVFNLKILHLKQLFTFPCGQ